MMPIKNLNTYHPPLPSYTHLIIHTCKIIDTKKMSNWNTIILFYYKTQNITWVLFYKTNKNNYNLKRKCVICDWFGKNMFTDRYANVNLYVFTYLMT